MTDEPNRTGQNEDALSQLAAAGEQPTRRPSTGQQPHSPGYRAGSPGMAAMLAPQGSIALSIVGAVLGAGVGAFVWFLVVHFANYQVGYIAILCGALAGWGAVLLGKMRNPTVGIIAALAGLGGILGGSYVSYYVELHGEEARAICQEAFYTGLATDPDAADMTDEEKEQVFEEVYQELLQSDELSYFNVMDGSDLGFMALFGLFGLFYGYRVGAGISKSG